MAPQLKYKKRVLTLAPGLKMTPQVAEILRVIGEQLGSPEMVQRTDGLAFYVDKWSGRA